MGVFSLSRIPFEIEGVGSLLPPPPTPADLDWARRNTAFPPEDFGPVMDETIEKHRHWRFSQLINRHFQHQMAGSQLIERAIDGICRSGNVVAARLLLARAESGPPVYIHSSLSNKDRRDMEVRYTAFRLLGSVAGGESDDLVKLAVKTLGRLTPDEEMRGGRYIQFMYETEAAIAAAANAGRFDRLDLFLEEGAWPDRFRNVYARSTLPPQIRASQKTACVSREMEGSFRDWMVRRGIADHHFLEAPCDRWSLSPPQYDVYLKLDEAPLYNAKKDQERFAGLAQILDRYGVDLVRPERGTTADHFNLAARDGRQIDPPCGERILRELRELTTVVRYAESRPAPRIGVERPKGP